ncbi:autotransporter domain-containing protein [Pseudoxanthomonas beigongshangi]
MKPTQRPLRRLLALALAAAAAPAFAQSSPFSQTIFFGDSLTDSGHFRPTLVQLNPGAAIAGRFTTNPGFVWSEFLAQYYGTGAVSANQGGTNYAVGGARTGTDGSQAFGPITVPVPALTTQLASYLTATGGKADARALYTVWGGPNDLFAAVANPAQTPAIIGAAVTSQITVVAGLKQAGAEYILVPNIPDLGKTPAFLNNAGATQLAATYNTALYNGLTAQGLRVIPLDTFNFLREITAAPAQYGFANVTTPACGNVSSLLCVPSNYVAPGAAGTYAFADGVHPSMAAHQMLGQYAISVLEGPRQLAVLPYTASVIGRSRADRVAAHIDTRPETDGVRWWGDLRGDSLRYDEGDFDGITPTGTFGLDWTRGDFVFGGFAGFGRGKMDFGDSHGSFKQSDTTLGGFVGWYQDRVWVNGQISYTWLSYDVDREIQFGPATRRHSGSPDGSNLTAAISAGYDFEHGKLRHGPVASVVAQRVKLDGYSESNSSSTALTYGDQDLDSLIGSVGWKASIQATEHTRPYAQLTYDHEFEEADRQVFASLQSMPGVMPYAVPGLNFDRNYGTLTVGARTQVFGLDADVGARVSAGKKDGHDATVFVSLGGGF